MSDTPSPAPTDAPDPVGDQAPAVDYRALYEKTHAELEKTEQARKRDEEKVRKGSAAARELEQLRQQTMTDTERLVAEARAETRGEVMREFGASRVQDAVRLAAHGRPVNVDALLETLDAGRFMSDDGNPDNKAIAAWVDRLAPAAPPTKPAVPDLGQGARLPAAVDAKPGKDRLMAAYAEVAPNL